MKKLAWIFILLCVLILVTFALSGEHFEELFSAEASRELFAEHRTLAGPLGAGLLVSDLALPIPTTVVIGAMGATIGLAAATFWGWLGLSLAGFAGYGLARLGGQRWANRLASEEEQKRNRLFFETWGGLAIVLSRMLPILPEAISITAGLSGMRFKPFAAAILLGSLPPAFAFAWIGQTAVEHPGPALWITVALMGIVWLVYRKVASRS